MSQHRKSRGSWLCEPGVQEISVSGDRDLEDFKIMGLDDITQGKSVDKEEKRVSLKKLFLDNSQVWKFVKVNNSTSALGNLCLI